jgi:glycosyltransferase involved in cell wall biosynthesis
VELAKGIGYLLEAWKRLLLPNAELLLVGEIRPEMNSLLRTFQSSNIRVVGRLEPKEVAKCYRESQLFVFPSVNEGLASVILEAMASGLPVAATKESGAEDCLTEGKDGFVLPARNVDALAAAISWCFQHPDERLAMGRAARVKVEEQFTLSHYEERQIAMYRSHANSAREHLAGA